MPEEEKKEFVNVRLWREAGATKLAVKTTGWEALLKSMGAARHSMTLGYDNFTVTKADGSALGDLRYYRYSDSVSTLLQSAASKAQQSHDSQGTFRPRTGEIDRALFYNNDSLNLSIFKLVGTDAGLLFTFTAPISDDMAKLYVAAVLKFFEEVYVAAIRQYDFRGTVFVEARAAASLEALAHSQATEHGEEVSEVA